MVLAQANLDMTRSDSAENKLDMMIYNTFGSTLAASISQTALSSRKLSTPCFTGTATRLNASCILPMSRDLPWALMASPVSYPGNHLFGRAGGSPTYAKRHRDNYSAVFWLNIKDEDSLRQSFAKAAKQIIRGHPSARGLSNVDIKENIDGVIDAVKEWLSLPSNTRWLMIYDNYDNPKLPGNTDPAAVNIGKFLPKAYQGSVIITTWWSQVEVGHPIRIRKLEDVFDSVKILSNASRREGLIDGKGFFLDL